MTRIKIENIDFEFDENIEYEKDGHIYCKKCNERVDGKICTLPNNKKKILRKNCKCFRNIKEQEKQREIFMQQERLRRNCFISDRQRDYTFENADEQTDRALIYKSENYVKDFKKMIDDNIGLLIYGNVGSGKTYLACSIANAIITKYGYSVMMRNFSQILNDLQKGGFNLDRNEYINRLTSPVLLIIDDFGMERNTEYAIEQIYNTINARYLKNRPTIITTNINYDDMKKEQENIMLGRIYSRIIEMCMPLRVIGADRRKIHSLEKMKKAKELLNQ